MPLSKPNNEKESDFIPRCMEEMKGEFPDPKQRMAICITQWKKGTNLELESFSDYPDSVSNNAKRGIELNKKYDNKCATGVGKARAQQLAQKKPISVKTIKRMYSYLSRAEEYYDEGDTSACGTISFLLWGGLAGKRWAGSKLKKLGLL